MVPSDLILYPVKIQWKLDTCKKCTLYKYLPCTVQRRSYSKKTVNQLSIYLSVLGPPSGQLQWKVGRMYKV